ncbi:hypothetical protein ACETK8_18080 [Brevundimonas staleyi]|uniref:Haem-binding uptake Tiki superfamily ChaN domain-containing protein n=1 Tax=Brevundimonas staleyi TaxID=74326 RepID=A0ABW0FMR2_9CAUL
MRSTRREFMAAGAVAAMAPGFIRVDEPPVTAEGLMVREGRYLPRWIELLDDVGERARAIVVLGPQQAEHVEMVMRDGKSQYASFLSEERVALEGAGLSVITPDPTADLDAIDAIDAIVEASRGHRVVMLNEAHVASRHRALLGRLLPRLRAEGFTHLAAEAFDDGVNRLGPEEPLRFQHGWYTRDPVFAEAVRQARELGYGLVAYEQRDDQLSDSPSLSNVATVVREQAQADNLRAALEADPAMRVLVFVGYGHLRERGPPFAGRLKHDTGIDPLTIGQAQTGAWGPHTEDAPPVVALLERFRPTMPVVLVPAGTRPVSAATDAELTGEGADLMVLHPALPDVEGRPGWLATDPARRRVAAEVPAGAGPRLLQAIPAAEPDPAIPADQFLVADAGGPATLFLRPGRYRLRLETATGFTPLMAIEV